MANNFNVVQNTTESVTKDPGEFLVSALVQGSGSRAIEAQEAAGQQEFVVSDVLPVDGTSSTGRRGPAEREADLRKLGFVLGDPVKGDDLFRYAKLPPGWTKKESDHSMWSYILDEKGRRRCAVFYKAAFYDRSAHLQMECRFRVGQDWDNLKKNDKLGKTVVLVTDGVRPIWKAEHTCTENNKYNITDQLKKEGSAWLAGRLGCPVGDLRNPMLFWDTRDFPSVK